MHYNIFLKIAFLILQFNVIIRAAEEEKIPAKKRKIEIQQDQKHYIRTKEDLRKQEGNEQSNERVFGIKKPLSYIEKTVPDGTSDTTIVNKEHERINENLTNLNGSTQCFPKSQFSNERNPQETITKLSPDQSKKLMNIFSHGFYTKHLQILKLKPSKFNHKNSEDEQIIIELESKISFLKLKIKKIIINIKEKQHFDKKNRPNPSIETGFEQMPELHKQKLADKKINVSPTNNLGLYENTNANIFNTKEEFHSNISKNLQEHDLPTEESLAEELLANELLASEQLAENLFVEEERKITDSLLDYFIEALNVIEEDYI